MESISYRVASGLNFIYNEPGQRASRVFIIKAMYKQGVTTLREVADLVDGLVAAKALIPYGETEEGFLVYEIGPKFDQVLRAANKAMSYDQELLSRLTGV